MPKSFQEEEGQFLDDSLAKLTISVSKDGEVSFICDWAGEDVGCSSMAHIFNVIKDPSLPQQIMSDLKTGCNSDQQLEEIQKITVYYTAISEVMKKLPKIENDKVVISPLDIVSS